jgi:hypothetical protein
MVDDVTTIVEREDPAVRNGELRQSAREATRQNDASNRLRVLLVN